MSIDREHEDQPWSLAFYRSQLVDASDGIDLIVGDHYLRVSNLPLFREVDGKLQQCIRVRVASGAPTSLTVAVREESALLDQVTIPANERAQSAHLFVPEVEIAQDVQIEIQPDTGEVHHASFTVQPQRKWTIHLAHHSHYDIGYTDTQNEVMASQLAYIDSALELATVTDDWPEAAKFRWNIEVNWPLQQWLRNRPKWMRDELVRRVQEGRIEIHALPFSMHTEAFSFDELARQLDFAAEVRETLGVEVVSAMQTDVPGATIGLSTLLTDAGVRYFLVAHNYAGRSIPHHLDGQDLERPFWWQAPDGEQVLVWYTDTLNGSAYMEAMHVGFGSDAEDVLGSLPEYLSSLSRQRYPYGARGDWIAGSTSTLDITARTYPHDTLHLRVQGAYADNASTSLLPSRIVREWNETWAWPKLRMSLNRDFMADVEARFGAELPVYSGDWTDWWADGIGSAAVPLAKNRQAQADLRTAQTLHALADHLTDQPGPDVGEDVQAAYEDMALFDEHTWGAANPWSRTLIGESSGELQWTRKFAFALGAEERSRALLDGGLHRLAPLARSASNESIASMMVFNPSTHIRTDLVRVFVPERELDLTQVDLVDLDSGTAVPFVIEPQDNARYRLRGAWLRFLARDVPGIGYARYGLRAGSGPAPLLDVTAPTLLRSDAFEVEIDPATGTISRLLNRASGRNLADPAAPFGFGAVILDAYTSAPGFNHLSSKIGLGAGSWLLGGRSTARFGQVIARESTALWERVTIRLELAGLDWLETTYILPHGIDRLDIRHHLHKPATMAKESLYVAFPFAGQETSIGFEVTGGWVDPGDPHVPGSARHFRAIRHAAAITAADQPSVAWATRQAPLVQIGNMHIPYAPFVPTIPAHLAHNGTIYSWALNNIWDTNFPPQQGGEMVFDYVIATGNDDARHLALTTGADIAQPLLGIIAPLAGPDGGLTPDRSSFFRSSDPRIEISHLGQSRHGKGLAIHLVSRAGETVTTTLEINHLPVSRAQVGTFLETDLVETPLKDGRIEVELAPGEIRVVRLDLGER